MRYKPLLLILLGYGLSIFPVYTSAQNKSLVDKGAYLSQIGDCTGCHTDNSDQPYAGGLGIDSPFGTIYASNITPDKKTGIGNYSRDDFEAALRHGIRKDGKNLYPAMPYTTYAKLTDEDIDALYAYFMQGVKPVEHEPPQTNLTFPFNMRWGLKLWNWLFATADTFKPDPDESAEYNRGAYMVEGLGHCSSCHTPRGLFFQQKAYGPESKDFLAGGQPGNWYAPNLRGGGEGNQGLQNWHVHEVAEYLATGRNVHSGAVGDMVDVITNSLSHLKAKDLHAMAVYLKSLPRNAGVSAHDKDESDDRDDFTAGARLYQDNCSTCHFDNGQGASWAFPPLKGNSLVEAQEPESLIRVILAGAEMPPTPKSPSKLTMPGFGWKLSDKEVAALATYVRGNWGNSGASVSAEQVRKVRDSFSEDELKRSAPSGAKLQK